MVEPVAMTVDQLVALAVLIAVVAAFVIDKVRADVVALSGAAILMVTGVVRPTEVQGAFASPAIIALAGMFVIAYAMELAGLLDAAIDRGVVLCNRIGATGIWVMIAASGAASAFLNNTPIVVMGAPVVRDVADRLGLNPKRYLIPLSYVAVLGGCCTLIGTSTNLLVNDMAVVAGQPRFGIFEITGVGLTMTIAGCIYLFFASHWLDKGATDVRTVQPEPLHDPDLHQIQLGESQVFAKGHPLKRWKAGISGVVFAGVILLASLNIVPISSAAFGGAVLLVVIGAITADDAYSGLRPEILMLIAGMIILGIALEKTGLAAALTKSMVGSLNGLSPFIALVSLYGVTLFLTELLSNATVAVLVTPVAVALAETMGVSARPFVVAVMMAGSAAFATPFGYQTNTLVFQMGGYSYTDFLKVGLPLNLVTWIAAVIAIPIFFPF